MVRVFARNRGINKDAKVTNYPRTVSDVSLNVAVVFVRQLAVLDQSLCVTSCFFAECSQR
jgi:hypothetical protein